MAPPPYERISPPEPRPSLDQRPRKLSVTEVETWIRDPYAIYAKKILNLRPIDPLDASASYMERGILIHNILEDFITQYKESLPKDPVTALLEIGAQHFEAYHDEPNVRSFWWPRFEHIAHWFVEEEKRAG